jgi:hypothetical protein
MSTKAAPQPGAAPFADGGMEWEAGHHIDEI